ncbi:sulfurtransferase TusA [Cellvibrio japonicus]|uniref:SirA protein homolog n=1 Tax=Cellvibrio japonicus (strain Ueda107) TaxID=498211 RepID=B3PKB1_CELJU|nr:sulfurtransferase TusA [Cellvibrio japonicus]ACE83618.1 SirA protein homolog [Cellvibrio japonicus Ueda107]QEI12784.1 sulfurtransferase TusA [Cellvibrio japonicus]QEI16358.1 sulfurtransferase TusA [Cellvibrio japonicus]QEI19936.1 sulfurtransferase TusA [Cellvibrio japonicus]
MNQHIKKYLDTSGLLCPEPVMLLHKAVRELDSGDIIQVTATDPSTTRDVPKFCLFLGHEMLEQRQDDDTYIYVIRKK